MAAFSLQRVLDLKKRREESVAIKLAQARAAADEARASEAQLEAQREEGIRSRTTASVAVGHLQNASYVIEQIDGRLADARDAVKSADAAVHARLAEFTTALQERRVLDRLKEKRMEEFLAIEAKADLTSMDAIALTRFVRSENSDAEGES